MSKKSKLSKNQKNQIWFFFQNYRYRVDLDCALSQSKNIIATSMDITFPRVFKAPKTTVDEGFYISFGVFDVGTGENWFKFLFFCDVDVDVDVDVDIFFLMKKKGHGCDIGLFWSSGDWYGYKNDDSGFEN